MIRPCTLKSQQICCASWRLVSFPAVFWGYHVFAFFSFFELGGKATPLITRPAGNSEFCYPLINGTTSVFGKQKALFSDTDFIHIFLIRSIGNSKRPEKISLFRLSKLFYLAYLKTSVLKYSWPKIFLDFLSVNLASLSSFYFVIRSFLDCRAFVLCREKSRLWNKATFRAAYSYLQQ